MKRVLYGTAYKTIRPVEREWRVQLQLHPKRQPPLKQHSLRIKSLLGVVHNTCFAPKSPDGHRQNIRGLPQGLPQTPSHRIQAYIHLNLREQRRCSEALKRALGACHRMRAQVEVSGNSGEAPEEKLEVVRCYDLAFRYVAFVDGGRHACAVLGNRAKLGWVGVSQECYHAALGSLEFAGEDVLEDWHRLSGGYASCRQVGAFVIPTQLLGVANMQLYFVIAWMLEKLGERNVNLATYNTVLEVLVAKSAPLDHLMSVVEEMHKLKPSLQPDVKSYALLLQAALKADKLNTAVEIVLRAPVGRHVKDARFFPALLQGMNVETQLCTFALTKLAALIEQVQVDPTEKQRLLGVLKTQVRGSLYKGKSSLIQAGITETLGQILDRPDIVRQLRPREVMSLVKGVSMMPDEDIGVNLARFVQMLHVNKLSAMKPALLGCILHEVARALKANVDGQSAGALTKEVVNELVEIAMQIAAHTEARTDADGATRRAIANSMMLVVGSQGSVEEAHDRFRQIEVPNVTSFNNLIWLQGVVGKQREAALNLVGEMQSAGVQPDARTLSTITQVFSATVDGEETGGFSEAVGYIVSLAELYNINVFKSTTKRIEDQVLDPVARKQFSDSLKAMKVRASQSV